MPYQPNTPPTGTVEADPIQKDLDTYHILRFEVQVNPNDTSMTQVKVLWAKGYMEVGVFKPVQPTETILRGQDLLDKINSATQGGTIYNEVKTALWELLVDGGYVEAGAIS